MRRNLLVAALLLTPLLGGVARPGEAAAESGQGESSLFAASWRADLDYLVETLEVVHPDLYARVDREEFRRCADELAERIPDLDERDVALGMMQLVALIEDGHTQLEPTGLAAFDRWFPVRFYRFTDGIFITAASDVYAPVSGEILEGNDALADEPALVNTSPEEDGWFFRMSLSDTDELEGLMDAKAYKAFVDSL